MNWLIENSVLGLGLGRKRVLFVSLSYQFFKDCADFSASAATLDHVLNDGSSNVALMTVKTKEELEEHAISIAPSAECGTNTSWRSFWNISGATRTYVINPRRACAARVTVVVLCVCVHSYLPPHTLESQKRDTNGFCAIQESFLIFPKNASFKSYGVICLYTSSSSGVLALFPQRNKLLCWFEAYSYVFTAQTTGLWKTACDSLAQTQRHRYTITNILIAPRPPPASAYTQYK